MGKKNKRFRRQLVSAEVFNELLCENEEEMGEGAAYLVTCEQLGVDPDDGYELLAELAKEPS